MDKRIDILKENMTSRKRMDYSKLIGACRYSSNYELLYNVVILFSGELQNINSQSFNHSLFTKYVNCINKLLPLTHIDNCKNLIKIFNGFCQTMDSFLNGDEISENDVQYFSSISKKLYKIRDILIEKNDLSVDSNATSLKIINHYLFNERNYGKFYQLIKDYKEFKYIIKNNADLLFKKIIKRYLKAVVEENDELENYYYLIINLLMTSNDYGLNSRKMVEYIDSFTFDQMDDIQKQKYEEKTSIIKKLIIGDYQNIEKKYNVSLDYTTDMQNEIKKICIPNSPHKNIIDLRDKYIVTIDGSTTECYDDACSFEKLPNGNYLVGLYIADPSIYVKPGTLIDNYAYNIGQTIYVEKNILMLPREISIVKSSLNMKGPKYAHAYLFEVSQNFDIEKFDIYNALINVKERLDYSDIPTIIFNTNKSIKKDTIYGLVKFTQKLKSDNKIRQRYLKAKESRNTFSSHLEQHKDGYGTDIVSELKVLTNKTLAKSVFDLKCPFIYRVNETCYNDDNQRELKKIVKNSPEFDEIIDKLKNWYDDSYYSCINLGHSGIGTEAYAHATTPLRNYSSLYNQRIIQKLLIDKNITDKEVYDLEKNVSQIAEHLNQRIILNDQYMMEKHKYEKHLTKKK